MNIEIICGAVIEKDGKIVIVQEGKEKVKGLWNLPAGRMKKHEKLTDAVLREVKEETGLDVALEGIIGIYERISQDGEGALAFYFKTIPISGDLLPQDEEIINAKWITYDEFMEMNDEDLRKCRVKKIVEDSRIRGLIELDFINTIK